MRGLKFRAWERGKMFEVNDLTLYDGEVSELTGWDNGYVVDLDDMNPTVMQFTGLQSAVGEDLYEGDIILDEYGIADVRWDDNYAAFRFYYTDNNRKFIYQHSISNGKIPVEIVGNIYQNEDLLK